MPIRDAFEIWNQYSQDGYVPGLCMTADGQLVAFKEGCAFGVDVPSKPGKYGLKIWFFYA